MISRKVVTTVIAYECPQCMCDMLPIAKLKPSPKGATKRRYQCDVCGHIEVIYKRGQDDGYKPYKVQIERHTNTLNENKMVH